MEVREKIRTRHVAGAIALALVLTPGLLLADDSVSSEGREETEDSQTAAANQASSEEAQAAQDKLNKALDSTATQWSFQFAY